LQTIENIRPAGLPLARLNGSRLGGLHLLLASRFLPVASHKSLCWSGMHWAAAWHFAARCALDKPMRIISGEFVNQCSYDSIRFSVTTQPAGTVQSAPSAGSCAHDSVLLHCVASAIHVKY